MPTGYFTQLGSCQCGDSLELLHTLQDNSVNLVITSPPFALQRQKEYGNEGQDAYIDWFCRFARVVREKISADGSFVIDLGGAYQKGIPVRSLYNYKLLIRLCEEMGFYLAEEFFWYNPAKLPSPIEWVNKRKIRAKDSVNTIWWLSKTAYPKADVRNVLAPYSERMKKLIQNTEQFYTPKERPSGHDISANFGNDNGGAIPSNLLQISNSESNSQYLRYCKKLEIKGHPARFPNALPRFFIEFLTDENDLVVDIFSGSNTTGAVAESLNRQWLSLEISKEYVATSAFRFASSIDEARTYHHRILNDEMVNLSEIREFVPLLMQG